MALPTQNRSGGQPRPTTRLIRRKVMNEPGHRPVSARDPGQPRRREALLRRSGERGGKTISGLQLHELPEIQRWCAILLRPIAASRRAWLGYAWTGVPPPG